MMRFFMTLLYTTNGTLLHYRFHGLFVWCLKEKLSAPVFFFNILLPSEYDSVFEDHSKTRDLVASIREEIILIDRRLRTVFKAER
jgi:hypothetical protein